MPDSYLDIAYAVLLAARRPLSARKILESAISSESLPHHLYGRTPHKTLQARLSEDILRNRHHSPFFRTGAGEFFLRSFQNDPLIPSEMKAEYRAPRRSLQLNDGQILSISKSVWQKYFFDARYVAAEHFRSTIDDFSLEYVSAEAASQGDDFLPIYSFVILHRDFSVLSYLLGRLKVGDDPLNQSRSIGFGGFVYERHRDLSYDTFFGVIESGLALLSQGTGMPLELAEQARYSGKLVPRFCALSKNHKGDDALFVVVDYRCPDTFYPGRPNLSFKGLKWISRSSQPNDLRSFDPMSEEMLSFGADSEWSAFVNPV